MPPQGTKGSNFKTHKTSISPDSRRPLYPNRSWKRGVDDPLPVVDGSAASLLSRIEHSPPPSLLNRLTLPPPPSEPTLLRRISLSDENGDTDAEGKKIKTEEMIAKGAQPGLRAHLIDRIDHSSGEPIKPASVVRQGEPNPVSRSPTSEAAVDDLLASVLEANSDDDRSSSGEGEKLAVGSEKPSAETGNLPGGTVALSSVRNETGKSPGKREGHSDAVEAPTEKERVSNESRAVEVLSVTRSSITSGSAQQSPHPLKAKSDDSSSSHTSSQNSDRTLNHQSVEPSRASSDPKSSNDSEKQKLPESLTPNEKIVDGGRQTVPSNTPPPVTPPNTRLLEETRRILIPIITENAHLRDPNFDVETIKARLATLVTDEDCKDFVTIGKLVAEQMREKEREAGGTLSGTNVQQGGHADSGIGDRTDIGAKRQREDEGLEGERPNKIPRQETSIDTSGSALAILGTTSASPKPTERPRTELAASTKPAPKPPRAPRAMLSDPKRYNIEEFLLSTEEKADSTSTSLRSGPPSRSPGAQARSVGLEPDTPAKSSRPGSDGNAALLPISASEDPVPVATASIASEPQALLHNPHETPDSGPLKHTGDSHANISDDVEMVHPEPVGSAALRQSPEVADDSSIASSRSASPMHVDDAAHQTKDDVENDVEMNDVNCQSSEDFVNTLNDEPVTRTDEVTQNVPSVAVEAKEQNISEEVAASIPSNAPSLIVPASVPVEPVPLPAPSLVSSHSADILEPEHPSDMPGKPQEMAGSVAPEKQIPPTPESPAARHETPLHQTVHSTQNPVPGLWFVAIGRSSPQRYNLSFHVDEESAAAAKRWGQRHKTFDPQAAHACVYLLCLPVSDVAKTNQELDQSASPATVAAALWNVPTKWPPPGKLIIKLNADGAMPGTWLAPQLGPQNGPLDVSRHIQPGTNVVYINQLGDFSEFVFVLCAGVPSAEDIQQIKKDMLPWQAFLQRSRTFPLTDSRS